jgi:hypothetical protein
MIKEFAIEPDVLNDWQKFGHFIDVCNIYHGRMISNYPSNWLGKVKKSVENNKDCMPKSRTKIIEKMIQIKNDKTLLSFKNTEKNFVESTTWISNAINLMKDGNAFNSIISKNQNVDYNFIINSDDCFANDSLSSWASSNQKIIDRNDPKAILNSCKWLIDRSKELIFIDQNFQLSYNNRFIKPFEHILRYISKNQTNLKIDSLQYHFSIDNIDNHDIIEDLIKKLNLKLKNCKPNNLSIDFYCFKPKEVHPRFIISDFAAINYEYGLDYEPTKSSRDNRNIVTIQSHKVFNDLYNFHKNIKLTFSI